MEIGDKVVDMKIIPKCGTFSHNNYRETFSQVNHRGDGQRLDLFM